MTGVSKALNKKYTVYSNLMWQIHLIRILYGLTRQHRAAPQQNNAAGDREVSGRHEAQAISS
jgi:hypothetical protein